MAWDVDFHSRFVPEFSQTRFYKRLITKADERVDAHLSGLKRSETAKSVSKDRKGRS